MYFTYEIKLAALVFRAAFFMLIIYCFFLAVKMINDFFIFYKIRSS